MSTLSPVGGDAQVQLVEALLEHIPAHAVPAVGVRDGHGRLRGIGVRGAAERVDPLVADRLVHVHPRHRSVRHRRTADLVVSERGDGVLDRDRRGRITRTQVKDGPGPSAINTTTAPPMIHGHRRRLRGVSFTRKQSLPTRPSARDRPGASHRPACSTVLRRTRRSRREPTKALPEHVDVGRVDDQSHHIRERHLRRREHGFEVVERERDLSRHVSRMLR